MQSAKYTTAALIITLAFLHGAPTLAEEPTFLWPAPQTSTLGATLFSGYTIGNRFDGANLGARALFFFRYFVAGLSGDMTFAKDGSAFSLLLDLDGRYGPLRAGFVFGLHWLPGRGGSPSPGIAGEVGLTIPLGIGGIWLDLAYRPNLIFLRTSHLSYHAVNIGLLIEAGL